MTIDRESRWMRLLFMVIFVIVADLTLWIIAAIAVVQFILHWISGELNANVHAFAKRANAFFGQIVAFVSYASDVVPFPFSPLPPEKKPAKPRAKAARSTTKRRTRATKPKGTPNSTAAGDQIKSDDESAKTSAD